MSSTSTVPEPPTLRLLHNMARAGGTLICRCLGVMPRVRLLSEIHPLGHRNRHFNAIHQYQAWFADLGVEDHTLVGFDRSIDRLFNHCEQQRHKLVLRDWAHLDFVGPPARRAPSFALTLDARLSDRYRLLHGAIVRHPMETWLSLRKMSVIIDNDISMTAFFAGYRRYLDAVNDFAVIRYEDFTAQPANTMKKLCTAMDIEFDPGFVDRWADNCLITGDVHSHSRAGGSTSIVDLPIRPIPPEMAAMVADNADYQEITTRYGYPF